MCCASWKGTKLSGILQNDAYEIRGLTVGARVEIEETSVFDYMLKKSDGTTEGGETNEIIRKQ